MKVFRNFADVILLSAFLALYGLKSVSCFCICSGHNIFTCIYILLVCNIFVSLHVQVYLVFIVKVD